MSDIVDDIDWGYYSALETKLYEELKAKLELAGGSIPISWDCGSDEVNFDVGPISWGDPLWEALYDIVNDNVTLWSAGSGYMEYGNGTMTLKEDTIEISYTTDMDEDYSEDIDARPSNLTALFDYLRYQGVEDESFTYYYDNDFTWNEAADKVTIDVGDLIDRWVEDTGISIEGELDNLMDDEAGGCITIHLTNEGYTMRYDFIQANPYKEGMIEIKPKDVIEDEPEEDVV